MACPCNKDANTCNCATAEDCKCGADCACENCANKKKEVKPCACAASGKDCQCGENCKC